MGDIVTLARLGDPDTGAEARALLAVDADVAREIHLAPVEMACRVVAEGVLRPWILGGAFVWPDPTQLGIEGTEPWIGTLEPVDIAPFALGRACIEMLSPLTTLAARELDFARATIDRVAVDWLCVLGRRLFRQAGHPDGHADLDAFLDGAGDSIRKRRTITVSVDDGPPIVLPIPRVCCTLGMTPGPADCPACPQRSSDQARRLATRTWLHSLDDAEFLAETGRPRQ